MRFRFSDLRSPSTDNSEGRSGPTTTDSRSRTVAPGYYPSSSKPSPLHLPVTPAASPDHSSSSSPPSFVYDNGTGKLDSSFIHDQGLPAHVRTTDQLADFIRWRSQVNTSSPVSPSIYSTRSSAFVSRSDSRDHGRASSVRQSASNNLPRPHAHPHPRDMGAMRAADPMIAGLGRRFAAKPVTCVLPGAVRRNQYEGFWLRRGTMRDLPAEAEATNRRRWWKKPKEAEVKTDGRFVDSSGWYDD